MVDWLVDLLCPGPASGSPRYRNIFSQDTDTKYKRYIYYDIVEKMISSPKSKLTAFAFKASAEQRCLKEEKSGRGHTRSCQGFLNWSNRQPRVYNPLTCSTWGRSKGILDVLWWFTSFQWKIFSPGFICRPLGEFYSQRGGICISYGLMMILGFSQLFLIYPLLPPEVKSVGIDDGFNYQQRCHW